MTRTETSMDWNEIGGYAQYKEGLPVSQRCLDILSKLAFNHKCKKGQDKNDKCQLSANVRRFERLRSSTEHLEHAKCNT